jgi:16S rRNA (uracil1498-N3)-methyltransferase
MPDRFFIEKQIEGDRASLVGAEAHHLLHVLRAKPGDEVSLFYGRGFEYRARIEHSARREVVCAILGKQDIDRELPFDLVLAVALPKGERQRWLVEKLVELGASRLVPLITERSVVQPTAKTIDRLRRVVIEASKQCGRNVLMEIAEPQDWTSLAISAIGLKNTPRCFLAHPGGMAQSLGTCSAPHDTIAAIGPEGGFTPDEIAEARSAGWTVVDLGRRVLRIETAAMVVAMRVVMGAE